MLEESTFHGKRADYVWLLFVSCVLLLVCRSSPLSLLSHRYLTDWREERGKLGIEPFES